MVDFSFDHKFVNKQIDFSNLVQCTCDFTFSKIPRMHLSQLTKCKERCAVLTVHAVGPIYGWDSFEQGLSTAD